MADTDTLDRASDDIRHDDLEFNPRLEPTKALAWLNLLRESEKAFEDWNDHCDKIEEQYANLKRLAQNARDPEFQMFWANAEVIKPSIYARPPIPVVVPKFKDRRPVIQAAAEMMERTCVVAFDLAHINELMLLLRDDVALIGRGVAWCRYESGDDEGYYTFEKVCVDFKNRRDFLHSLSRNWSEVTWVAGASYLTREDARDRFREHSGDEYQDADYKVDRDTKEVGGTDARERGKFWEIWDKVNKRVIWVSDGCEHILDEDKKHLDLQDCFPCPKPAYGTVQRNSLVPVPDVLQYKDQLDELNLLTSKIHALSDALEAKGFYPAGGGELADAVQAAVTNKTPGRMLVPIANWAAFGGSKEIVVWMPIEEIASTITQCVNLRRQVIEDIYQIMGLSDIMRGATDPRETAQAQQLKSQYGSSRIRDKQQELVRMARDLVQITSEIITEQFDPVTIIEMSQTQLPTQAMQRQQAQAVRQQLEQQQQMIQLAQQQMQQNPQMQQQANPQQLQQLLDQAQQMMQTGQDAITKIMQQPTIEQVLHFLEDNRAKAFTLDIETDSTIQIDEQMEKQQRGEFIGMLAQLLPQLGQLMMADPGTADFCGEILKFAVAPFRAGRQLDGAIDALVEQQKQRASQPKGDDPTTAQNKTALQIEQMKDARERDKDKADTTLKAAELKQRDEQAKAKLESDERMKMIELRGDQQQDQAKAQQTNLKMMEGREKHQIDMIGKQADMRFQQEKAGLQRQQLQMRQQDMRVRQDERRAQQQFKNQQMMFRPQGRPQ